MFGAEDEGLKLVPFVSVKEFLSGCGFKSPFSTATEFLNARQDVTNV
jgi:hypothetical protein